MKPMNKGKPVPSGLNEPIVEQAVVLEPGIEDSDQNHVSRRDVLKKWAKAGAIASIAAAGYTASLGCFTRNTCKCKCPSHNRSVCPTWPSTIALVMRFAPAIKSAHRILVDTLSMNEKVDQNDFAGRLSSTSGHREIHLLDAGPERMLAYFPLLGLVFKVDKESSDFLARVSKGDFRIAHPRQEKLLEMLLELGLGEDAPQPLPAPDAYAPTMVTLCPTTECNLRCVYCYASGGSQAGRLSSDIARTAIDYIIGNARDKGEETTSISFHGGGEPTLHISILRDILDY